MAEKERCSERGETRCPYCNKHHRKTPRECNWGVTARHIIGCETGTTDHIKGCILVEMREYNKQFQN